MSKGLRGRREEGRPGGGLLECSSVCVGCEWLMALMQPALCVKCAVSCEQGGVTATGGRASQSQRRCPPALPPASPAIRRGHLLPHTIDKSTHHPRLGGHQQHLEAVSACCSPGPPPPSTTLSRYHLAAFLLPLLITVPFNPPLENSSLIVT